MLQSAFIHGIKRMPCEFTHVLKISGRVVAGSGVSTVGIRLHLVDGDGL